MPLNKSQLNSRLIDNQAGSSIGASLDASAKSLTENTFAKNATLLGSETGAVFGGITSMESKIDNAGQTAMGDAMCSFGDQVTGLSGVADPASSLMTLSAPSLTVSVGSDSGAETTIVAAAQSEQSVSDVVVQLTGLGAPVAKLEVETLGASSLDAISATATDVEGKSSALKAKIQGVASEVKAASGTGGGATGGLGAITDTIKKAESMVADITAEVSSIQSLNPAADLLSNVKNDIGTMSTDLQGNLNSISATASDLGASITSGINAPLQGLEKSQGALQEFFNKSPVKTGLGMLQDITEDITNAATSLVRGVTSNANLGLGKVTEIVSAALDGTLEGIAKATQSTIREDKTLSPKMKAVIGSIPEGKTNDEFVNEVKVKAKAAGIEDAEIEATQQRVFAAEADFSALDTTISGSLITTSDSFVVKDFDLTETLAKFDGQSSAFEAYTYIDSKEELGTEFRLIKRPITGMVVHASDTYTNQNIGAEELHVDHTSAGDDGIQYHLVIRRDGRLQRARPMDRSTNNVVNGHTDNVIEICLVGGLNCATGCDNPDQYRSSQSFTREQMTTFESVCEAFYRRYHGGQVFGHNEIQPLVTDPYFDVSQYVETVFRKKSVYEDLSKDTSLTPSELITKKPQ
jgi:N-acetylmuramoyl-L-alanine amidase